MQCEVVTHLDCALVYRLVAEHTDDDVSLDAALVGHIVLVCIGVCAILSRLACLDAPIAVFVFKSIELLSVAERVFVNLLHSRFLCLGNLCRSNVFR